MSEKLNTITKIVNDIDGRKRKVHSNVSPDLDVAVVGAGPYGLSAAAHLKAKDFGVCIFGEPMDFWASKMPQGMLLRSPREASTIADPRSKFTLEAYEAASGTKPCQRVARETFVDYGRWFQSQLAADLDRRTVSEVRHEGSIFKLTLSDGTILTSRRVVVAAGVGPFRKVPVQFAHLSASMVSHCYEGRDLKDFAGKRVVVIGAGQSALESAALLKEAGSTSEVIAKISTLRWIGMRKWLRKLGPISEVLYSKYDVGPMGISRLVAYPRVVSYFPMGIKDRIRTRAVRPAGAPWLIPRLPDVKLTTGCSVVSAKETGGELQLALDDGSERRVDHVLLGTGYRVDISKYEFLSPDLVNQVHQIDGYPDVSAGFSTSVPGLHFVGATAARNFGPLLYFVAGTEFASRELTSRLTRKLN
jgi:thioredoxin reductase